MNARGHFPNEQAALKCVYLAVSEPPSDRHGPPALVQPAKAALNAFEITLDGRLAAGRK